MASWGTSPTYAQARACPQRAALGQVSTVLYRHLPPRVTKFLDATIAACDRRIKEDIDLGSTGTGDLPDVLDAKAEEDPDVVSWRDYLPPKYRSQYDLDFLRRYRTALQSVATRIHEGRAPVATTTMQELALRSVAEVAREAGEENRWDEDDQIAFEEFCDEAVADADIESLFDMSAGGIEDDDDMAHLRFDEWFAPFRRGKSSDRDLSRTALPDSLGAVGR